MIRARACRECKASIYGLPAESLEGRVALIVALGWLVLAECLMSGALTGAAGLKLFAYMFGGSVPLLLLLGVALYREQAAGGVNLGPGVVVLVALTWLIVSLWAFSEPEMDLLGALLWLLSLPALFVLWSVLLVPAAWRTWRAKSWRGAMGIVGYLLPLPVAAVVLFAPGTQHAAIKARFDVSEGALNQHVEDFRRTGVSDSQLVGLYRVESTSFGSGCVMLQTAGVWGESGLAYCEGAPAAANNTLVWERVEERWWTYEAVAVD